MISINLFKVIQSEVFGRCSSDIGLERTAKLATVPRIGETLVIADGSEETVAQVSHVLDTAEIHIYLAPNKPHRPRSKDEMEDLCGSYEVLGWVKE